MKKTVSVLIAILFAVTVSSAQGYKVGDIAVDFKLKNIDGKMKSLSDISAKGYIVVFTCNHCPYAQAYEQRVIDLDKKYASLGYPVVAINPNDPKLVEEDSFDNMKKRAKEKGYTFPYLIDETHVTTTAYGATRTPHVFVLQKTDKGTTVEYIGAIDDNTEDAAAAKNKYVEDAVNALLKGEKPAVASTKAIGCTIKWKKS